MLYGMLDLVRFLDIYITTVCFCGEYVLSISLYYYSSSLFNHSTNFSVRC